MGTPEPELDVLEEVEERPELELELVEVLEPLKPDEEGVVEPVQPPEEAGQPLLEGPAQPLELEEESLHPPELLLVELAHQSLLDEELDDELEEEQLIELFYQVKFSNLK